MEDSFAEQIIPGTFIRVQAEALIAPKGVASGNVGIVGTAANAAGGANVLNTTQILSSLEDAARLYAPSDPLAAGTLNLMRSLELLFRNGATTVYARGLPAGATTTDFGTAVDELVKEDVNLLVAPELTTANGLDVLRPAVNSAETNARDIIAVVGSDASTVANIKAQVVADKRVVLCAPGVVVGGTVLPGNYTSAAVGGLIASLAVQSSPTNKVLPAVSGLSQKFSYGQLKDLLQGNVLPLESRQGIRVVRGITTQGAAFTQITTRRIVDYAKAGVRVGSNPYIGRLNNARVRAALKATLDGFLSGMVLDEMLTGYTLDVSATRQQEINGIALVTMTLQPTFSIDFIKVIMNLE